MNGADVKNAIRVIATICLPLYLAACGGNDKDVVEQSSSRNGVDSTSPNPGAAATGQLVTSGFGQDGEYVWVTALVRNTSKDVGQTVTVQFNVFNSSGKMLVSESQVESFSRPGQLLVVGTQLTAPRRAKATKVHATLLIEDTGAFSTDAFPEIKTGPVGVTKDEYRGITA